MKKITTFLMALLVVAGVNAASDWQGMMQKKNNHSVNLTTKHVQGKMVSQMAQESYQDTCSLFYSNFVQEFNETYVLLANDYFYYYFWLVDTEITLDKTYSISGGTIDSDGTGYNEDMTDDSYWQADDATITFTKDEKGLLHARGNMTFDDDIINLVYDEPGMQYIEDSCTDMIITDEYAQQYNVMGVQLTGEVMTYVFFINGKEITYGKNYTFSDMDQQNSYVSDGSSVYTLDSAEIKITQDEKGLLHAEGFVVSGSVTIQLSYDEPEKPTTYEDVYMTVPNAEMVDYRTALNAMEFMGKSSDNGYYFVLDYITKDAITGTFDENTCDITYCYVVRLNGNESREYIKIVKATAVVTEIEGGYKAEAKFYCMDAKCYNVTFTFVKPTAKTKVTINSTNLDLEDATGSGMPEFSIWANDATYEVSLYLFYAFEIAGQYTIDDFHSAYCTIADHDKSYQPYSADITVTENNGVYTVTGTILCYGDVEFTLNLTQSGTAIDHVEMKAAADKRLENGQLIILRDGVRYTMMGTTLK